jgi:type IV pilus assembly protein PilV
LNIKQSSGFAMIEVLLAVVVLAIGLLAGSKMQMLGLNYTQGAQMRTNATMAANDIIDRMRINPTGVIDGNYENADTDNPPADPNCIATGCTPAQLADHDIRVWAAYFGGEDGSNTSTPLVGAQGTISRDATTGLYTIEIAWKELIEGSEEERKVTVGVDFN